MPKRRSSGALLAVVGASLTLLAASASAQSLGFSAASIEPSSGVMLAGPGEVRVPVAIRIRRGYHINSNTPNEPYLIPTALAWDVPPLRVMSVAYPPAEEVRYDFSEQPLSVFSERIEIVTTFKVDKVPAGCSSCAARFASRPATTEPACRPRPSR